ncbi:MAG: hypothetical protein PHX70_03380 [Clostridium sp.]|nr:hypothetical protein [Clostridium sp.]
MKNNIIYVDFTHKKISAKKTTFTFESVKSFMRNIFSSSIYNESNINSPNNCKRILKKKDIF